MVKLLVVRGNLVASDRIPIPGDQIGFVAGIRIVAAGGSALRNYFAVQGNGSGTVSMQVVDVVGTSGNHNSISFCIVLKSDFHFRSPFKFAFRTIHGNRFAVNPLHYLIVLKIFGNQVVPIQNGNIIVIIRTAGPAFEALHVQTAQQRSLCRAAVSRIVGNPGILLVVAQEAHHFTVLALCGITAVGKVGRPVLEGGIVFMGRTPLCGETPAMAGDLVRNLSGFPRILITGSLVSPNVQINKVKIVANLFFQLIETCFTAAAGKVKQAVDRDALIQPVPAVFVAVIRVVRKILIKRLGFGVHFVRVDMDTKACAVFRAFFHQGIHIFRSADTFADVAVIGVVGVVSFPAVALQQNALAETVGIQINLLDAVESGQEWVGRHTAKVHGNAIAYQIRNFFGAVRIVHNVAERDCAVLPVNLLVVVHVGGNGDFRAGHLCVGNHIGQALLRGNFAVVVPGSAAQAYALISALILYGSHDPGVSGPASSHITVYQGTFVLGIAPQARAQFVVGNKRVHVVAAVVSHAVIDFHIAVTAENRLTGNLCALEVGILLRGSHRNQAVVGDVDGLHGILIVIQIIFYVGDVECQGILFYHQFRRQHRVNVVSLVLHGHGIGRSVGPYLAGNRRDNVHIIDPQGINGACLSVKHLASRVAFLHGVVHNAREVAVDANVHFVRGNGSAVKVNLLQHDGFRNHALVFNGDGNLMVHIAFFDCLDRIAADRHIRDGIVTFRVGSGLVLAVKLDGSVLNRVAFLILNLTGNAENRDFLLTHIPDVFQINIGNLVAESTRLKGKLPAGRWDIANIHRQIVKEVLTVQSRFCQLGCRPL